MAEASNKSVDSTQKLLIPNTTQVPNILLDQLMPVVQSAAWTVISFVCRKTFGWGKWQDRISLTQFERGTGLARKQLIRDLAWMSACGLLVKTPETAGDAYELNLACDISAVIAAAPGRKARKWRKKNAGDKKTPVTLSHQCTKDTISGDNRTPKLVTLGHTQKPNKPTTTKPKRKNRPSAPVDLLPAWITEDKNTQEAWAGFVDHRRALKKPLTGRALSLLLKKLQGFKVEGDDPAEILNTSVMNGWRGVFPLKENGNGNDGRQASNPADARQQRIIHRARTVSAISENLGRSADDSSAGDGGGRAVVLDGHTLSVSR